jgi:diguanylate cyclase
MFQLNSAMAILLIAMAGGYCVLGAILGMKLTRAPSAVASAAYESAGIILPEPAANGHIAESELPNEVPVTTSETFDAAPADPSNSCETPSAEITDELPEDWEEILDEQEQTQSTLEASVLVLRKELHGYRESLIDLETHIRVVQLNLNEVSQLGIIDGAARDEESSWHGSLENSRTQLRQFQAQWCARVQGVVRVLRQAECPADQQDLQESFLQALHRESSEQEKYRDQLARLPGKASDREAVIRLLAELTPLLHHCHSLEPLLQLTLIELMVRQDRLAQWESHEFTDPSTHLRNRAGLELWLRQWRDDKANQQRQVSAIMLDVDNTAALNTQWGTRIGDVILNSLGTMINGVLRKNRGIDFTVRCTGQRYLVVLADTGPRGANSAAERIRQTIEQCYFEHPLGKIQVTISAGVSDIRPHDGLETLFDRLQRALRTAKQAGRNCAALDEGTGPICLMAPQLRIREHSAASTIQEAEQELLHEQAELAAV